MRLLFATPRPLLSDPPVGNHCPLDKKTDNYSQSTQKVFAKKAKLYQYVGAGTNLSYLNYVQE